MYRMTDLIEATGLSRRKIAYYRFKRILPPPITVGRYATYSPAHLHILKRIIIDRVIDGRTYLDDAAVAAQSAYPDLFPDHERHKDLQSPDLSS